MQKGGRRLTFAEWGDPPELAQVVYGSTDVLVPARHGEWLVPPA